MIFGNITLENHIIMAFVSQADRGIQRLSFSGHLAAPGSYQITPNHKTVSHSYAPFCSTSVRHERLKKDIPGPGTYMNAENQWHPTLTTYSNDNNILIKLHTIGTTSFQSKQKRFGDKVNDAPGPGEYQLEAKRQHRHHSNPVVKRTKVFNREDHRPSISKTIYLSQRRVRTEEANYPQLLEKKAHCVTDWSKDKVHRFQRHQSLTLGPGTYDLTQNNKPAINKKTKKNPSNFFMSNTVRTFDTIVYNAQNQETLMLREIEDFKREEPAPGSYNVINDKQNQSEKYKNKSFGSTKKRFEKSKTEEDVTIPFYNVNRSSFEHKHFLKKSVPFNSESKRMVHSVQANPGPGYYTVQQNSKEFMKRPAESFGSTVDRKPFEPPKQSNILGPGYYQTEVKKWEFERQSTIFTSKIPRTFQQPAKTDNKFATYDLSKEDISRRAYQKKAHRQNLERIDCGKPAFDKLTPRFSHYEDSQSKPKPLTRQQIESIILQKKQVQRQRKIQQAREQANNSKQGFISRGGQRFQQIKKTPGVGDYTIRNNWTKKSYNIKYGIERE